MKPSFSYYPTCYWQAKEESDKPLWNGIILSQVIENCMHDFPQVKVWFISLQTWSVTRPVEARSSAFQAGQWSTGIPLQEGRVPWSLCPQQGLALGLEGSPRAAQGLPRDRASYWYPLPSWKLLNPQTTLHCSSFPLHPFLFCVLHVPFPEPPTSLSSALEPDFLLMSPLPCSPVQC